MGMSISADKSGMQFESLFFHRFFLGTARHSLSAIRKIWKTLSISQGP